jgi:ectoine hydroxylase-related dioxygenase (phytanoyl-CoA dioxygenase family)
MEVDRAFFEENGYVVVRNVVPKENCQAVIDAMFAFLEMDPSDPSDWYRLPLTRGGMIELYQHQALWDNRQNENIYAAFSALLGETELLVTIDRCNFNPPVRADKPEYDHAGFLHWDADPARAHIAPLGVQGVLYLAETGPTTGGFVCVPGHHKLTAHWAATGEAIVGAPSAGKRRPESLEDLAITPILGGPGDLVIWDNRLLHGNGRNLSNKPRFAQYISMFPRVSADAATLADRIHRWKERLHPDAPWAPGDPREKERLSGVTATLTPLGQKLLGLTT